MDRAHLHHEFRRCLAWAVVAWASVAVLGTGAAAPHESSQEPAKTCAEQKFLGRKLEMRGLGGVLEWRQSEGEGRWLAPDLTTPVQSSAQVILLHLWAHWCAPCKKDFEIFTALTTWLPHELYKKYGKDAGRNHVQFLYLAEDTPNAAMREFLTGNANLLKGGGNFQDAGGQVLRDLQRQTGCTISLPLTLLLDKELRIQASFVGSIESRREKFAEELVRLAKPAAPNNSNPDARQLSSSSSGGPL